MVGQYVCNSCRRKTDKNKEPCIQPKQSSVTVENVETGETVEASENVKADVESNQPEDLLHDPHYECSSVDVQIAVEKVNFFRDIGTYVYVYSNVK